MKVTKKLLPNLAVSLISISYTPEILATFEADVTLESPMFGETFISANVDGLISDSCKPLVSSHHELFTMPNSQKEIHIFLKRQHSKLPCVSKTKPFQKRMFIGDLNKGEYVVKVFDNENKVMSAVYNVPEDVEASSIDLQKYYLGKVSYQ